MFMMSLYALRDKLAKEFAPPFEAHNADVAIRMSAETIKKMPDYELYYLGDYSHASGKLDLTNTPNGPVRVVLPHEKVPMGKQPANPVIPQGFQVIPPAGGN